MRAWNRRSCSSSLTENQYLIRMMPDAHQHPLELRAGAQELAYSSSVQKPITCSTPARLYQLRSNSTISPAAGRCAT